MNKLYGWAGLGLAVLMAGCGDNGFRSPDFDAQLIDVRVTGPTQTQVNTQAQFRAVAHLTTPPSQQGAVAESDVTNDAAWQIVQRSDPNTNTQAACDASTTVSDAATVDAHGLVTAGSSPAQNLYVKATYTKSGQTKSGCAPFIITPASHVLRGIVVTPSSASVPKGSTQQYCARGFYDDTNGPQEITDTTVVWSSSNNNVATVPAAPNNTGSCIVASAVAVGGPVHIVATAQNTDGATLTGSGDMTVTNAAVKTVLRVVPATATVQIGATQPFVACGTFSDGSNASDGPCANPPQGQPAGEPIDNGSLDWSSDKTDKATIDATGVATGVAATDAGAPVTITATLKDGVGDPAPAPRSANALLTVVVGNGCTVPLLPPNAIKTEVAKGPLCLACSVDNPDNVIDDQADSAARMNATLSLLDLLGVGFISLQVDGSVVQDVSADNKRFVGFLLGRPTNDLLSAELLASVTVSTVDGAGDVVESGCNGGATCDESLTLDLLGSYLIPGVTEGLVAFQASKPFQSLRLTFSPALASVLNSIDIFNACVVATPPAE